MTCDHDASKASLTAFLSVTTFVGFQMFPDGEVQLLANCRGCGSTLAVVVEIPRGAVVHGEIAGDPTDPDFFNDPRIT